MITDLFTKPNPAELLALSVASYLAGDETLALLMASGDDGNPRLVNTREQVDALSLIAIKQNAFVGVGLPRLTPISPDDKGITGSLYIDVPVLLGVAMRAKHDYETYLHRLCVAVISRQHYATQDVDYAGLAPYLSEVSAFDAAELGEKFQNYASARLVFRQAQSIIYNQYT